MSPPGRLGGTSVTSSLAATRWAIEEPGRDVAHRRGVRASTGTTTVATNRGPLLRRDAGGGSRRHRDQPRGHPLRAGRPHPGHILGAGLRVQQRRCPVCLYRCLRHERRRRHVDGRALSAEVEVFQGQPTSSADHREPGLPAALDRHPDRRLLGQDLPGLARQRVHERLPTATEPRVPRAMGSRCADQRLDLHAPRQQRQLGRGVVHAAGARPGRAAAPRTSSPRSRSRSHRRSRPPPLLQRTPPRQTGCRRRRRRSPR